MSPEKAPLTIQHLAVIIVPPTLDLLAGFWNYNVWNSDVNVADWSSTYKTELISGSITMTMVAIHLFVYEQIGLYLHFA